jgi:molecular chaperone DnaK
MVRDAEMHMAEDRARRQDIDARNHADALAYQVERLLSEQGEQVPLHEKARAEQLVSDVRTALQESATGERIRTLSSDLEQLLYMLESRAHGPRQTTANGRTSATHDEVVDAEYTEKK